MIGKRIKELREQAQLSQADLAKMMNVSQQRLGLIEKGGGTPTIGQVTDLVRILNCSYEYLIEGKDSSEKNISRLKWLVQELQKISAKL